MIFMLNSLSTLSASDLSTAASFGRMRLVEMPADGLDGPVKTVQFAAFSGSGLLRVGNWDAIVPDRFEVVDAVLPCAPKPHGGGVDCESAALQACRSAGYSNGSRFDVVVRKACKHDFLRNESFLGGEKCKLKVFINRSICWN